MNKSELEQLATFMRHTSKTHSGFYHLLDDVYQKAKISKLLLLSKKAEIEKYKRKSLEEIEVDDKVIRLYKQRNVEKSTRNNTIKNHKHNQRNFSNKLFSHSMEKF